MSSKLWLMGHKLPASGPKMVKIRMVSIKVLCKKIKEYVIDTVSHALCLPSPKYLLFDLSKTKFATL